VEESEPAMDVLTKAERSALMAKIRSRDTGPERAARSLLRAAGVRFRMHRGSLPGTPDIVIPTRRIAVFVHGCFWHRHVGCSRATTPSTRAAFWRKKFAANIRRDRRVARQLRALGWRVFTVWECDLERGIRRVAAAARGRTLGGVR
jgi:DNA mismatch endonuclease (patch repair protein)